MPYAHEFILIKLRAGIYFYIHISCHSLSWQNIRGYSEEFSVMGTGGIMPSSMLLYPQYQFSPFEELFAGASGTNDFNLATYWRASECIHLDNAQSFAFCFLSPVSPL